MTSALRGLHLIYIDPEADPGEGVRAFNPPPKDYPADSEIGRKGVAN